MLEDEVEQLKEVREIQEAKKQELEEKKKHLEVDNEKLTDDLKRKRIQDKNFIKKRIKDSRLPEVKELQRNLEQATSQIDEFSNLMGDEMKKYDTLLKE